MNLVDIDSSTVRAFYTCLHLERPEDLVTTGPRRTWHADLREKGYRAQVLQLDDGSVVGKCHTIPIDHSPFSGRDLLAILCLYVHMYDHHIGDQRGQNRGRTMLEKIEAEARAAGWKGIVAWGMDWEIWNPVSFYERMNYCRADQEGKVVAVWKPFCDDAKAPSLMRLDSELPGAADDKVSVLVADNAWCSSFDKRRTAREAIVGIEDLVEYVEVGEPWAGRILHLGSVGGVFLDGLPYRPHELIGPSNKLRAEIVRLYAKKRRDQ